jgi:arsenate reductase (thioredoxin)
MKKQAVLFICSFNSVRSQIAEGLLNARCRDRYAAYSAGIAPAGLNPYAALVMKEYGIDITSQRSKKLLEITGIRFDYVVTMCDRANLAIAGSIPEGAYRIHQNFVSPSEIRLDKAEALVDFRTLRDEIDRWLSDIFPDCPENRAARVKKNE